MPPSSAWPSRAAVLGTIIAATPLLFGCTSSHGGHGRPEASNLPKDPEPVTITADKAATMDLGGGAHLIIPPGAMAAGATVKATYRGRPGGTWAALSPTSAPVELISDPPNAIHGLLTLEFPVPVDKLGKGIDGTTAFGISTFDSATGHWIPVTSTYDAARHMVVAQIPHFSWWNPFTWDFDQIWADVAQGFGTLVGTRSGPARCTGSPPPWLKHIVGVTNDADIAIHACAQSEGSVLDVQIQNNRPYSQILTYGAGVKWGWHETGNSAADAARNALMDRAMKPNQLYIPPLGSASVGIFQPPGGGESTWHIGPTRGSIGVDLFTYLAGQAAAKLLPAAYGCAAQLLTTPLKPDDITAGALRDYLLDIGGCAEANFKATVTAGGKDNVPVQQLAAELESIKHAGTLATAIVLTGGATWRIADLVADWIASGRNPLGNGFRVFAQPRVEPAGSAGPSTPTPSPPATKAPAPSPPATKAPAPTPREVNAYDNYGPANDGHAMCRGNPGNTRSMPGGTLSQTFTVRSGVASLSGAKVQIDPDPSVTAHLSIAVNGFVVASAEEPASGDTHFSFGPVGVTPGQKVQISIYFTATYGKIITVYTSGDPGGTFTASNPCPDGAPSFTTSSTGLRAVVSGLSS
ncbi:hypothetical protein ABZ570_31550 [Micromonospora sp. NPDC007271]|uniref:hypothetical protein n=1 Tax=Micromonospora sp. NPDC007271 TaxID=3154587 RepID=UPI0034092200